MGKRFFLIALSLFALAFAFASDSGTYDYDSLYYMMIANNTRLRQSEQDIYSSQLTVKDAKSLYQPNINYSLFGTYMANPLIGQIIVGTDGILGQMGLPSNSMPNGFVTLYDGMDNTFYNASVSLTQPLITWGKIPLAVKLAKTSSSIQEIKKSDLVRQLDAELGIRYYSLYYINQIYGLIDKVEKDSDQLVSIAEQAKETGMMSEQDVLDARIQAQEIDVQRAELDSQFNGVIQGLRVLVGKSDLDVDDISFVFDESILNKYENSNLEELRLLAVSPSSNQLQMVNKLRSAAELQEDLAWKTIYGVPDVLLNVSAGYGGSRFPFAEVGWRQADDWSVNVSVIISGNIWDGGKRINSINRAKSSQETADITYDSAVQTLETAVVDNYQAMVLALKRVEYLELKKENENLKLEKINTEVSAGNKSKKDVLEQQIEIAKNDIELISQKISLVSNIFMLDYLTNQ